MLLEAGLYQVEHEEQYSFWDYKAMRFQKNEGMLIDFQLATASISNVLQNAWVDVDERTGKGASDHAPLVADYDTHALSLDQVR